MRLVKFTYLRAGLILSVLTVAAFLTTFTASGSAQELGRARFDGWGYTVVADPDGSARAQIDYDHGSVADLRRYAATNRALAHQLATDGAKTLTVSVSFRRPLSVDEFRAWAAKAPLQVDGFQLRLTGTNGQRWTLGGAPTRGELVSAVDLNRNLDRLRAKGAADVRGVIVAEGTVAAGVYDQLANDPAVFLVDVTPSAARDRIIKTVRGVDPAHLSVAVAPAFSWMEDLGLENFR